MARSNIVSVPFDDLLTSPDDYVVRVLRFIEPPILRIGAAKNSLVVYHM